MADQVDGIEVIIDVDTKGVMTADKVVNKSTKMMESDFKKVDVAITGFNAKLSKTASAVKTAISESSKFKPTYENVNKVVKQSESIFKNMSDELIDFIGLQNSLGNTLNKNNQIIDKNGNIVAAATNKYKMMATSTVAFGAATNTSSKNVAGLGRNAGMAGIQIQQFVGQIQGGQSVMLALSQQSADLGWVLGAPLLGAIVGISSSLVGLLMPALLDSSSATNKLSDAMESMNRIAGESDGIHYFTEQVAELAKVSEDAARLLVLSAQNDAQKAGRAAAEAMSEEFNDAFDVAILQSSFDALKSVAGTAAGTGYSISQEYEDLGEKFGLTGKKAREAGVEILVSMREMEEAINGSFPDAQEKITAFQEKLLEMAETSKGDAKTSLLSFVSSITEYTGKAREAAKMTEFLNETLKKPDLVIKTKEDIESEVKVTEKTKNDDKTKNRLAASYADGIIQKSETEIDTLTRQMEVLDALYMEGNLSFQKYNDAKVSIALQANKIIEDDNKKLAQNELARQNMILGTTASIFGSLAELSKTFQGEQSNTYKALFAVSKGFAIAQAGLNLNSAMLTAFSDPSAVTTAQKFANYAAVATAGGQLVSAISSASYGGGRLYGGGVESDKIYPIAENGRPEVLQQSDGSQYLIGGKGKVIPNGDIGGMSGGGVTINIANNAAGVEVTQTGSSDDGRIINLAVNEVANQINRGQGVIPKALKNSTSTQMRATR